MTGETWSSRVEVITWLCCCTQPCFVFSPASCAGHGRSLLEYRLLFEILCYTGRRWPCLPPRCRLQGSFSSHNSDNKSGHRVHCDRLQKIEQVFEPLHVVWSHSHLYTHTQIRHPPSDLSWLIRFLPFLPVWIWINRHKLSTSLDEFRDTLPPPFPSLPSLYRSAVCRCAAVCNRFFSAALQPEASTGLSGRKSITAGLSLACGGAYGREIRT